jgi:hypothetical protein
MGYYKFKRRAKVSRQEDVGWIYAHKKPLPACAER